MRDELRILTSNPIYPDNSGGNTRIFNLAKMVSDIFQKMTIYSCDEEIEFDGRQDSIHIIQCKKFKNNIDKISFYFKALFSNNYHLRAPSIAFKERKNTLFQIDGPYLFNLLMKNGIEKYILDEHNVYWEIFKFPAPNFKHYIYYKTALNRDKLIELKALKNASYILACSQRDMETFIDELPLVKDKITVIPNCVNFKEYSDYVAPHKDPLPGEILKILFMGSFSYSPNIDALQTICKVIGPPMEKFADFFIIGKNPPPIKHTPNVHFFGYVKEPKDYISTSDICIAPLRYGSGTRLKILEYMALGKAIISTSKGAEGIEYTNGYNIIIENNLLNYPQRIIELIKDDGWRKSIGSNARELIRTKYDWKIYREQIRSIYEMVRRE